MKCTSCGFDNPAEMRFCGGCGARLSGAVRTAGPNPDSAAPDSIPPAPAPSGLAPADSSRSTTALHGAPAAEPATPGERRLVTVLFVDVTGFTSLSEKLDPEAVRDLITACFDHLVPCIQRYGGTIDKFVGDEIMAVFGAPRAHENDPERALRAALGMRDALTEFNRERRVPLRIHFGVNTGLVYAGDVGGGGRRDYSVMGDAVNVASRLKATAKSGEIIVGVDTRRQAGHLFEWDAAGSVRVKGRAEPVTAHRLVEALEVPPAGRHLQGTRGISSPLVGRDPEVALFGQAIDRLRGGEGGVVSIVGEAGLGKSRLVAEVRTVVEDKVCWLEGRTLSFGKSVSYWPFLELVQAAARIESDDGEEERLAKLDRLAQDLFGETKPEVLPYLATLLALRVPEEVQERLRYLDGEAMGRQIFRSMLLLVTQLARRGPLVLVFEDVHWLDGSSAALLEHLLPLARGAPVLYCLVGRPEPESALGSLQDLAREKCPGRCWEIVLPPLSSVESVRLVHNLIPVEEFPTRLRDTILQKAEGNPFYAEEVIRNLIDVGGLVQESGSGSWRVTERASTVTIPSTVQGVIMARVDRLDEDLKQVLRYASVVGRSFFYRVLASVAEADLELDRSLADLETRELVREKAREPELEYIFKHALVQEATYESILLLRRKEIHQKVAVAIEALFAGRLEEFHSLLAYHYSKAEEWEKAQEYLFKAGDQSGRIAADSEALAHYEHALAAYGQAFGERWDPVERAAVERKIGEAFFRRGEHERAREYLYRAVATLGNPFPTSPAGVQRALVSLILRQLGHRLMWWVPRRPPTAETVRRAQERILPYWSLCWIDVTESPVRMVLDAFSALNLAEDSGIGWVAAMGYAQIGMICDLVPLPSLSRYYHRRSVSVDEQVQEQGLWGAQHSAAGVPFMLGIHEYIATGDWARASDYERHSRSAFLALGRVRDWGSASHVLIHVLVDLGELTEALALCQEVIAHGHETGDRITEAWGRVGAGEVLFARGKFAEAEASLIPAAAELLAALDVSNAAMARARLAHCCLKRGKLDEAQALLAAEQTRVKEYGIRGFFARNVWTGLAALNLALAGQAQGSARSSALNEAKAACRRLIKHGKLDLGALVPGYRMQGAYEWLRGNHREAEKWWLKSLDLAEKLGARYEGALTRLEIGRRLGDLAELKHAEAEFAEMGAAFDLAEARRLLGREEMVPETETASEASEALAIGGSGPGDAAH